MATRQGAELSELLRRKAAEVRQAAAGLEEEIASRNPPGEDRWSIKQVISHLRGTQEGHVPGLRRFLDEDTPLVDIEAGNPFFSASREGESLSGLLSDFEAEFDRMAEFVRPLTEEQLRRRARIPMLKGSPLGEQPTLAEWIAAVAEYHVDFHVEQLRTIRREVGS